jgi:hypothetical protein
VKKKFPFSVRVWKKGSCILVQNASNLDRNIPENERNGALPAVISAFEVSLFPSIYCRIKTHDGERSLEI